jgi:hypothetical protein
MVFDAPNAISTCTRRIRSNTPLQALTLLNDEGFFEFAQALAARVRKETKPSNEERVRHAFRLCLARSPNDWEQTHLTQLLTEEAEVKQLDGLTTLARVLLNLDEFITRE